MKMRKPKKLTIGDTIGLIGASSPAEIEKVELSVKALKKLGLKIKLGESVSERYGYLSGTDDIRASDVNKMFADENIKGIFNIRGGYGSQRLLHLLDYDMIKDNHKIFAGYSDTTALHIAFNQLCGLITYHSPMPSTELYKEELDEYTKDMFYKNLFSDNPLGKFSNPENEEIITLRSGVTKGEITGGNLSLMSSSLGTPFEINTKGKIFFIEEIDEQPYRIDRMLVQLMHSGKFKDCAGIIFGAFTNCEPNFAERSLSIMEILNYIVLRENKPALCNFRCGHCLPTATIPLGSLVKLDATQKEITFLN